MPRKDARYVILTKEESLYNLDSSTTLHSAQNDRRVSFRTQRSEVEEPQRIKEISPTVEMEHLNCNKTNDEKH